jgi:cysteine desulfurase
VSPDGRLDLDAFEAALTPASIAAVQAANNETGVVQPMNEIAAIAKAKSAFLISDAVQAIGRLPLASLQDVDTLFFSAHKFGGPKGVGAAIIRDSAFAPQPLLRGGGQERRQRSGTENMPGIAGLAAALEAAVEQQEEFALRAETMQGKLEADLRAIAPDAVVFGEVTDRLPNTTCFAIPGRSSELALMAFDLDGIAVSSGSACASGRVEHSHVLSAMGVSAELGACAIRVSTGWTTTEADIERFLAVLGIICSRRPARQAA